jgi:3-deoxy-D-manno-octulosonic-acid transferase
MHFFMRCAYDLLMSAAIPFFAVRYALRGRTLGVLARRFVLGKDETTTLRAMHKPVWIHAVSVGEVNLIAPLLREVKSLTGKDAVVSVINPHAFEIAWRRYGEMARVIYLPVDVSVILRRFIDVIDPSAFIAAETEIWPNLFWHLHRRGVPISIVNGRISDKSLPRYVKSRWLFFVGLSVRLADRGPERDGAGTLYRHRCGSSNGGRYR